MWSSVKLIPVTGYPLDVLSHSMFHQNNVRDAKEQVLAFSGHIVDQQYPMMLKHEITPHSITY